MDFKAIDRDGISGSKFFYLVNRIGEAHSRHALLDWFTPHQRPVLTGIPEDMVGKPIIGVTGRMQELEVLKELFAVHIPKNPMELEDLTIVDPTSDYVVYGIFVPTDEEGIGYLFKLTDDASDPPFKMYEQFQISSGDITNCKAQKPFITDVGKFLLNQLILVAPFGDLIPYHNETFNPGKLDDIVAALILEKKVTRDMYNKYMKYGYWYGMDGSIATPTWSEKSLTTDPEIHAKKKELLEKYKDSLDDPLVLSQIEAELTKIDAEWLKGDVSEPFFASTSKKTSEQRKKLYLTFGLTVSFDKNTGSYEFVEESLEDGWTIKNLDIASNDVRRGSYGRGIETAKGGEQTKFVLRIFQELTIDEDDCHAKKGIRVLISKYNKDYYLNRWLTNGNLYDQAMADQSIGKVMEFRGPQYCKTKPGFCYRCVGELFRKLDMKAIGMNEGIVTSGMTSAAMKSMHISGISTATITDFHRFLR